MHSLSSRVLAAMEYPLFWLLLVVPATAAIMAFQYPEYSAHHNTGASISPPIKTTIAARPGAYVTTELHRQSAPEGNIGSHHAVVPESQHFLPTVTTDSVRVPVSQPSTTVNGRVRNTEGSPAQRLSVNKPGAVNSSGDDTSLATLAPEDYSGSPAIVADLRTIMNDNPYLPTADSSYDSQLAGSESLPPCPQELYLGGNDYAAIRLAQMGCDIPGG